MNPKITAVKAMQLKTASNQCLIKIETDAGITGYGEAGASGATARSYIHHMRTILIGADPLEIDRLFNAMCALTHPYLAHVPTISGIDIALWDVAGKILGRSVSQMLNGRVRDSIMLYTNTPGPADWFDPASCRAWAAAIKAHPVGWQTIKLGFEGLRGGYLAADRFASGLPASMLYERELRTIGAGYERIRAALGDDMDFIVHCHNEWDVASAIRLSEVLIPSRPLWIEDPLPVAYSESWVALKRNAAVRIKTGEKLELPKGFLPFLMNKAIDVIHPDIVFAGGITGMRRIAELADVFSIPVVMHNIGSAIHNVATAHFGATARNFVMTETRIGTDDYIEAMIEEPLIVGGSMLKVPDGAGLGITLVPDVLKANLLDGEPYWD
ncbi:MAG: mandelate racemase/muconate lactonizing enzyme family protein [Chloroflexota bacterium]|nr:mandelate racemase/muconate lactonizing enzyme family protein [Chloroflexota bacterium]